MAFAACACAFFEVSLPQSTEDLDGLRNEVVLFWERYLDQHGESWWVKRRNGDGAVVVEIDGIATSLLPTGERR